jgi:hypothetical protein
LARCKLDLDHPKFRRSVGADTSLQAGLKELQKKVARDHRLSVWVSQPMPGFPQFHGKIWKWDFGPEGSYSSTRKGWRLLAHVPDPKAPEPIRAVAFLCYPKSATAGYNPKEINGILKDFLAAIIEHTEEERFRHQGEPDGKTRSLCYTCFETVVVSDSPEEIAAAEEQHHCAPVQEKLNLS